MSIRLRLQAIATIEEAISSAPALASNSTPLVFNGYNTEQTLSGSTTPAVTIHTSFAKALAAGAGTIDLTSLPSAQGVSGAVTFSGLKLQAMLLKNASSNGTITVSKGASNGYGLDSGGADFDIPVAPGATALFFFDDEPPDVADGAKTIDLAGTGTQELQIVLVAG